MAGFKNTSLNVIVKENYFEQILMLLKECSDLMVLKGAKIQNHEEKITAHIVENYLKDGCIVNSIVKSDFPFSFILENPEKYNVSKNTFAGRVDIKVISLNYFFRKNLNDYYTIECKRLDGKKTLNEKYVTQGILRYVVPPIKYQSYNNKNIMFGYIIEDIDVLENIKKINVIHKTKLSSNSISELIYNADKSTSYCYMCESEYMVNKNTLILSHIFYDFSSIIE